MKVFIFLFILLSKPGNRIRLPAVVSVLCSGDPKLSKQDAQLSQRDRAAGCVIVFAKSRRLELGDNILQTV